MLGALVSAGASLIGGLFSSSSEKKRDKANAAAAAAANKRNEERVSAMNADVRARAEQAAAVPIVTNQQNAQQGGVDTAAMMQGAEDAGFNPITWLRNGGMQAYSWTSSQQSSQVYNSQLMDAALAGSSIFQEGMPPLATARGTGEVIGSALVAGAGQWVADANQERQNQFQMEMLNAQLQGRGRANVAGGSGYVPTAFFAGTRTTSANSAALKAGRGSLPIWDFTHYDNDPNSPNFGKVVKLPAGDVPDLEQALAAGAAEAQQPNFNPYDPFSGVLTGAASAARRAFNNWLNGTQGSLPRVQEDPRKFDGSRLPYGATY